MTCCMGNTLNYPFADSSQSVNGLASSFWFPDNADMDKTSLSSRLRQAMGDMTETALQKLSGVPQSTINRILSGESRDPRRSNVDKLASALGVSSEWLISGTSPDRLYEAVAARTSHSVAEVQAALLHRTIDTAYRVPVTCTAEPGTDGAWSEHESQHGNGFLKYPSTDSKAYAIKIKGDGLAPRCRHDEFLVIEPDAAVGPGDEVLVSTGDRLMVCLYQYTRSGRIHLASISNERDQVVINEGDVRHMHPVTAIARHSLWVEE